MGLHFFKTGILPQEYGVLLGRLFEMRQSGDYEDKKDWKEEDVIPMIEEVKGYIDSITDLLSNYQK